MDRLIRVFSVVVSEEISEEIFELMYNEFRMFEKRNGLMYQQTLNKSSDYKLPNKQELEKMNTP
jgi:hypothetical protein